jgi:hypothetical protein
LITLVVLRGVATRSARMAAKITDTIRECPDDRTLQ